MWGGGRGGGGLCQAPPLAPGGCGTHRAPSASAVSASLPPACLSLCLSSYKDPRRRSRAHAAAGGPRLNLHPNRVSRTLVPEKVTFTGARHRLRVFWTAQFVPPTKRAFRSWADQDGGAVGRVPDDVEDAEGEELRGRE